MCVFFGLIAKIFVSEELGDLDMFGAAQNIERKGLTCKILRNKELAVLAGVRFSVLGMDDSYCLGLNTLQSLYHYLVALAVGR